MASVHELVKTMNALQLEWTGTDSKVVAAREACRLATEVAYTALCAYNVAQHAVLVALTTPAPAAPAAPEAAAAPAAPAAPAAIEAAAPSYADDLSAVPMAPALVRRDNVAA